MVIFIGLTFGLIGLGFQHNIRKELNNMRKAMELPGEVESVKIPGVDAIYEIEEEERQLESEYIEEAEEVVI